MKVVVLLLGILGLAASCGVYNSKFDCPPGKGIGCKSVGEVLDLIVEKEEGEDIFAKNRGTAILLRQEEESDLRFSRSAESKKKKLYLIKDDAGELAFVKEPEEGISR